jgi:D-glycero-alpha-D-manno-heptose-7-phosphate kinase
MIASYRRLPKTVTTITPQRISFVGGGTDLPSFYREYEGGVISSAIDQYVYVTVKRHSALFQEEYSFYSGLSFLDFYED